MAMASGYRRAALALWFAVAALPTMLGGIAPAQATATDSARLCVAPVANGAPIEADIGKAWRMVSKVLMLPGVPRPVIHAVNRGGVWTIDEQRRFVPFGGVFPSNMSWDHFARDPENGRVAGRNYARGIFVIDPGETQFTRVAATDRKPLRQPYDVKFVVRYGRFVIADATGLYTLDRENRPAPLPFVAPDPRFAAYTVRDFPALGALTVLVERTGEPSTLFIRFDDGVDVPVLTLQRSESIRAMELTGEGDKLLLTTNCRRTELLPLPRKASADAPPAAATIEPARKRPANSRNPELGRYIYRADPPSIGKTLLYSDIGLFELRADGTTAPIDRPFDPRNERILSVAVMPASRAAVIFTARDVYALEADGTATRVPGGGDVGEHIIAHGKGIIPVRNEMLALGKRGLFLIVDRHLSGNQACAP
jgi:hypothetical protein